MRTFILFFLFGLIAYAYSEKCGQHEYYIADPVCYQSCQRSKPLICEMNRHCYCKVGYVRCEVTKKCISNKECAEERKRKHLGKSNINAGGTVNVKLVVGTEHGVTKHDSAKHRSLLKKILLLPITIPKAIIKFVIEVILDIISFKLTVVFKIIKCIIDVVTGIWKIFKAILRKILDIINTVGIIKIDIFFGIDRFIRSIIQTIAHVLINLAIFKLTVINKIIFGVIVIIVKILFSIIVIVSKIALAIIKIHEDIYKKLKGLPFFGAVLKVIHGWIVKIIDNEVDIYTKKVEWLLNIIFVEHHDFFLPLVLKIGKILNAAGVLKYLHKF